jgi:recombinational DNA repair ATPase RecF
LREAEWDSAARERERALADSRDHLLLTLKALNREQAAGEARDDRIADLQAQLDQYRQQIAALIAAAVVKNRTRFPPKSRSTAAKLQIHPLRTGTPPTAPPKSKSKPSRRRPRVPKPTATRRR